MVDMDTGDFTPPPRLDCAKVAIFLDFDGTLVDIAPTPDAVKVPADIGDMLTRLEAACNGALAIVSGRSLSELEQFLDGFGGLMVGSHGSEARGMAPPMDAIPAGLADAQSEIRAYAADNGLLYEHKTHGGAVHFRTRPEAGPAARAFMDDLTRRYTGFAVQPAKMAFELRPDGFSKDGALALLSKLPQFSGRAPVYLGDDSTDEPALLWAQTHGGYGIKIGDGASGASHQLDTPEDVLAWLRAGLETKA